MISPAITFIVSAFHRPLSLRCCLASLAIQTFSDFEIIVTDNSFDPEINAQHEEICRMDPRIRYRLTRAQGCDYAAEEAVPEAKGEYVSFPSDDSMYVIQYAAKLIRMARERDLELVFCDLIMCGEENGGLLICEPRACMIDKTNFILKKDRFIPFPGKSPTGTGSDGMFIDELMRQGIRWGKVGHPLAVHT